MFGLTMNDPLAIYLHDHLAGANFAVELLENLQRRHSSHETGALAGAILGEVRGDRKVLQDIIERLEPVTSMQRMRSPGWAKRPAGQTSATISPTVFQRSKRWKCWI